MEWLITDELISLAREAPHTTPSLLQAVATHVQTSHTVSCFDQRLPLKFVFGPQKSMIHLITVSALQACSSRHTCTHTRTHTHTHTHTYTHTHTHTHTPLLSRHQEVEDIHIPGYSLESCGEYYYLQHRPEQASAPNTPDIDQLPTTTAMLATLSVPSLRSKTPDCRPRYAEKGRGHRRSTSACVSSSTITSVSQGNIGSKRRGSVSTTPFPRSNYASSVSLCKHVVNNVYYFCIHVQ